MKDILIISKIILKLRHFFNIIIDNSDAFFYIDIENIFRYLTTFFGNLRYLTT